MKQFATTYPQLMNQAIDQQFSPHDLEQLAKAHHFAVKLSEGIYRAQGVPLLIHLTRSSSIIMYENNKIQLIIATLLHAAYIVSFFKGSCRQRPRQSHRKLLQREFGHEVEALIWKYTQVKWYNSETLDEHINQLDSYSIEMQQVLLMRLSNELEDYLDNAMGYTNAERKQCRMDTYGTRCIELAKRLHAEQLANNLSHIFNAYKNIALPAEVICDKKTGYEQSGKRLWQANLLERFAMKCIRVLKHLKIKR